MEYFVDLSLNLTYMAPSNLRNDELAPLISNSWLRPCFRPLGINPTNKAAVYYILQINYTLEWGIDTHIFLLNSLDRDTHIVLGTSKEPPAGVCPFKSNGLL
jgi:hypothetical protein